MNSVECFVTNCQHYSNNLCGLDKIKVDGPAAKDSSSTCCLSFTEKKGEAQNSIGAPEASSRTLIQCDARNCTYNHSKKCDADSICIDSCSNNVSSKSCTACNTFVKR